DLGDDQAPRSQPIVDTGEDHFRQPFMIDPILPGSAIRVGVGPDEGTRSENVLTEVNMTPEVGVGDGFGEPEQTKAGEQEQRAEGEDRIGSSSSHARLSPGVTLRGRDRWLEDEPVRRPARDSSPRCHASTSRYGKTQSKGTPHLRKTWAGWPWAIRSRSIS